MPQLGTTSYSNPPWNGVGPPPWSAGGSGSQAPPNATPTGGGSTTTTQQGPTGGIPNDDDQGGGAPGYGPIGLDEAIFAPIPEFTFKAFNAPTAEDAQNEAGYKFRLDSGTDALQRSAAAKGVLRTGGTLKDVLSYGQNFATQEYNNVYERALKSYGAYYQGEKDRYAPRFAEWQMGANWAKQRALAMFQQRMAAQSGNNSNYWNTVNTATQNI